MTDDRLFGLLDEILNSIFVLLITSNELLFLPLSLLREVSD
jgi:hypothetical protein